MSTATSDEAHRPGKSSLPLLREGAFAPPQRRRKCNNCGKVIQTHTNYKTRRRELVTEARAMQIGEETRAEIMRGINLRIRAASRSKNLHALRA